MTRWIHDAGAMPEGRAPPAPIFVCPVGVEDEPAALHFRIAEFLAPETRHLLFIQRQIHMLRGIAVQIVNIQGTVTGREIAGRVGIRAAQLPTAPGQPGVLKLPVAQMPR